MLRTILKVWAGSMILLIATQACAPGAPTADPNSINTAIAQTGAAGHPCQFCFARSQRYPERMALGAF